MKIEIWTFPLRNCVAILARNLWPVSALYLVPDATVLRVLGMRAIRAGMILSIRLMKSGTGPFLTPNLAVRICPRPCMLLQWTRWVLGCGRIATFLVLKCLTLRVVWIMLGRPLLCEPCIMVTPPTPISNPATKPVTPVPGICSWLSLDEVGTWIVLLLTPN